MIGWVSPSGEFMPCQTAEHNQAAKNIVEERYSDSFERRRASYVASDRDIKFDHGYDYSGFLLDQGWIGIQLTGPYSEKEVSQAQIDTCFKLFSEAPQNRPFTRKHMRQFLADCGVHLDRNDDAQGKVHCECTLRSREG